PGRPRLAPHAPRLPLRGRAPGHAGHLPQLAEPGRVARALRHRLDRTHGTARPAALQDAEADLPRRHDGDRGRRARRVGRRRGLRLGRARPHDPRRRRDLHRVGGEGRGPDVTRRQPVATPRRPLEAVGAGRWSGAVPGGRDGVATSTRRVGRTMDLDFTPDQEMLHEAVAGVCARHSGLDVVRQMEDDPIGYSDKFWQQLAELGLLGMTLPEEHGGSGMTMLDAVVVYTELGRALAPSPHFVSSVMSGGVRARAGSDAQRAEWLPRISSGEAIITPAWLAPSGGGGA